ncbi:MAG TPA: hypothetical protein VD837_04030 [Terriglobales bacterium]|nr:hypothetical protein [Terriglobales bacterium]
MRDNHQGYPELRDAYERDGLYFGVVRVTTATETASFEFGVEQQGYFALRRILQSRPFENLPGIHYRYFFTGRYGRKKLNAEPVLIGIRVEQGKNAKTIDFDCPTSLASNLVWFQALTDLQEAAALKRIPE